MIQAYVGTHASITKSCIVPLDHWTNAFAFAGELHNPWRRKSYSEASYQNSRHLALGRWCSLWVVSRLGPWKCKPCHLSQSASLQHSPLLQTFVMSPSVTKRVPACGETQTQLSSTYTSKLLEVFWYCKVRIKGYECFRRTDWGFAGPFWFDIHITDVLFATISAMKLDRSQSPSPSSKWSRISPATFSIGLE